MRINPMNSIQHEEQRVTSSERARGLCSRAKELEEAGEFEDARAVISEFWQRIGDRPQVEGLDQVTQAEVLLRAGVLSGWIGSVRQISGAQEIAKDLISESAGALNNLDWSSASLRRVST
jgi:hypothetical protein